MDYARAVADPVRLRIVAALGAGPRSVASLARELDIPEAQVARHARALEAMRLLQRRDESGQRMYELLREPRLENEEWDELPLPVRRSAAASTIVQMHAMAAAAVDAGGFDAGNMHLSRTGVPAGAWDAASRLLVDTWRQLAALVGEAEAKGGPDAEPHGTAMMMLFSGEHAETAGAAPAPEFGEDEARERTYGLVEALEGEMTQFALARWDRVAKLAEEVRLVARAAMALDPANQLAPEPHVPEPGVPGS